MILASKEGLFVVINDHSRGLVGEEYRECGEGCGMYKEATGVTRSGINWQ